MTQSQKSKPWGGRFQGSSSAAAERLNASIPFDWRLAPFDLVQNRVYASELNRIGILTDAEVAAIDKAIDTVTDEVRNGQFEWSLALEDVHMNLEHRLTELAGDAARRIHTGRSRNDQVATVFRMWLRSGIDQLSIRIAHLVESLLARATDLSDLVVPGYTHLQRAQLVTFGHHLHAYAEMLVRDLERSRDLRSRLNRCPLGSGALAGSPYPLDRERLARDLGFEQVTRNSMDAVADRDFALEFLSWANILGSHLSRLSEDVILWMSAEFGWISLPDEFCTGSSIMPQKKNPDLAELTRGKTGRLLGNLTGLSTVLKGLPLTYNKDLQEDKEPVFDTWQTLDMLLQVWPDMIAGIQPNPDRIAASLTDGHLLATDIADYLVLERGVPFREAHHIVGQAVAAAEQAALDISQMSDSQLTDVDQRMQGVAVRLNAADSVAARSLPGGPAALADNIGKCRDVLAALDPQTPEIPWAFELEPPAPWCW